jgi:hypothetical protein
MVTKGRLGWVAARVATTASTSGSRAHSAMISVYCGRLGRHPGRPQPPFQQPAGLVRRRQVQRQRDRAGRGDQAA